MCTIWIVGMSGWKKNCAGWVRRSPVTKKVRLRPRLVDTMLTIALSKGKMLELTLDVFRRAGYALGSLSTESRRLVFPVRRSG